MLLYHTRNLYTILCCEHEVDFIFLVDMGLQFCTAYTRNTPSGVVLEVGGDAAGGWGLGFRV